MASGSRRGGDESAGELCGVEGECGLEGDGVLEGGNGICQVAGLELDRAEMEVRRGEGRVERDGAMKGLCGLREVSGLGLDGTQGVGEGGVGG